MRDNTQALPRAPINTKERKIGARAIALAHIKFDTDHWEFRTESGGDVGRDCSFELSEDDVWLNHKIECQVKGTEHIDSYTLKGSADLSFALKVKTITYALHSPVAFVLLLVDNINEKVYYRCIQEAFENNENLRARYRKASGESTVNIRIPLENELGNGDARLQEFAQSVYVVREDGFPARIN